MAEAENFEKLLEKRPKEALKYVQEFNNNPFWKYYQAELKKKLEILDEHLRVCPLSDVKATRGVRAGILHKVQIPERVETLLESDIELEKEAAKIEAARKPEKGKKQK